MNVNNYWHTCVIAVYSPPGTGCIIMFTEKVTLAEAQGASPGHVLSHNLDNVSPINPTRS